MKWVRRNRIIVILLVVLIFVAEFLFSPDIAFSIGYTIGLIISICILVLLDKLVKRIFRKKNKDSITCPICNSETVIRTIKKGKDTGRVFLVCINYPKCRGRIPA